MKTNRKKIEVVRVIRGYHDLDEFLTSWTMSDGEMRSIGNDEK